MEDIISAIIEGFAELYLEIAAAIVEESKLIKLKKWQRNLLKLASIIVNSALLALLVTGIVFLSEGTYFVEGIAMTAVGGGGMAVHILLLIGLMLKEKKSKKAEKSSRVEEVKND